jgi:hypothetical protein
VRRYVPGSGLLTEELVADAAQLGLEKVVVHEGGGVIVLWEEVDSDVTLYEREFAADSWSDSRPLNFDTEGFVGISNLVRASSGALMWIHNADVPEAVSPLRYYFRDPDGNWSDAQSPDAEAEYIAAPVLATYDLENFRVFYNRRDTSTFPNPMHLWSARYVKGRGFLDHEPVATTYYYNERPETALDENGRGIVVWRHRDAATLDPVMSLRARWLE